MKISIKVQADSDSVFKIGIMFPATTKAFMHSIARPIESVTYRLFLKNCSYKVKKTFLVKTSKRIITYP